MVTRLRLFAGALILSLVVVPAVVRATRVFDPSGRASIAPSFKSSFDVPPHAAEIPPDLTVQPLVMIEYPVVRPVALSASSLPLRDAEALRGPPVRLRW